MSSVNTNESFDGEGKLDVLSLQDLEFVTGGKKGKRDGGINSVTSIGCNSGVNSVTSNNCGGKAAMFVDLSAL